MPKRTQRTVILSYDQNQLTANRGWVHQFIFKPIWPNCAHMEWYSNIVSEVDSMHRWFKPMLPRLKFNRKTSIILNSYSNYILDRNCQDSCLQLGRTASGSLRKSSSVSVWKWNGWWKPNCHRGAPQRGAPLAQVVAPFWWCCTGPTSAGKKPDL